MAPQELFRLKELYGFVTQPQSVTITSIAGKVRVAATENWCWTHREEVNNLQDMRNWDSGMSSNILMWVTGGILAQQTSALLCAKQAGYEHNKVLNYDKGRKTVQNKCLQATTEPRENSIPLPPEKTTEVEIGTPSRQADRQG